MNPYEFEQFLKYSEIRSSTRSDSEKISSFIQWCKDRGIEEVILRLSTDEKNWLHENYFLDFTTSRIIVSKKSFTRKLLDTGFIAGMAPFPYMILTKDKKVPDFKKGVNLNPSEIIRKDISNFFIWYSEIEELCMRKGIETTVSNMLGTAINANFLTVKSTSGKEYAFRLPVSKNGSFEKIYFWLNKVIPVKVSTV
ncbi:MAG TPA: hypothetical protein VE572_00180 [Nitrososphaeraceae archaeon]|nr:hypothetical protein [Nitrososphaeraceae archaeon]